jgi:hypothetical protein
MALAIENGTTATTIRGYKSDGLPPTNELWSTECLRIKNAPTSFPDRILDHSVVELLKKIDLASTREATLPDKLLSPDELQVFIETLCNEYAVQAA